MALAPENGHAADSIIRTRALTKVIYPVLVGFCAAFLWLGLRNFRRRVLV